MKKILLFGICISIITLLLIPSIPAIEISIVKDAQLNSLSDPLMIKELLNNIKRINLSEIEKTDISNALYENLLFNKEIRNNDGGDSEPLFFPFLGIFVYLIIAYIFFAINAMILRFIGGGIRGIISNIVARIQQGFESVSSIIVFLITIIVNTVSIILSSGITIGTFVLDVILIIITGIFTLLLMTIQGIGNTIAKIWNGIGMILRFILDIIYVILETIFPNILQNLS